MWSLDYYYCINYSLILLLYKWTFSLFRHSLYFSYFSYSVINISTALFVVSKNCRERDLLFEENHCTKLRTLRACALILQAVLEETEILRTNGKSLRYFIERRSVLYTRPHKWPPRAGFKRTGTYQRYSRGTADSTVFSRQHNDKIFASLSKLPC